MRLDPNPIFRKVIVPWYDSEAACLIMIALMFLVFIFGFVGVSVAHEYTEYLDYIWVPGILMAMSGGVIISAAYRLIKRYVYRYSK